MANPCTLDAERARGRLAALGLTQTALAERCGLELRTLQRWFAGGRASLDDAERVAAALGVGTCELWAGVPGPELTTAFARIRPLLRRLGEREGTLAHALRMTFEHFDFVDRYVDFSAHPARGFVHREPISERDHASFAVLRVDARHDGAARLAFGTQVGRAFRYEFGEVLVEAGTALLVEHFHTRSVRAAVDDAGGFHVWVWVPNEMRELVIVADADLPIHRVSGRFGQTFDLRSRETRNAVCFRPAPMHLRAAGLPAVFDRIEGPRDGRVDLPIASCT